MVVHVGVQGPGHISRSGGFYPDAAVALDFVNGRYRAGAGSYSTADFSGLPSLTVTRSTVGYDLAGTTQFLANVARIAPGFGLLVEESRTNLFLNAFAPATQNVTITAVSHTITVWGTGSVTVAAGTATISNGGAVTAGAPRTIGCTVGGTISVTVTGSPSIVQVEAGSFGTSPMPSTGATFTRAADVVTIGGLSIAPPYTILLEAQRGNVGELLTANTNANGVLVYYPSQGPNVVVREASVSTANVGPSNTFGIWTTFKSAARLAVNDVQAATSGSLATADTSSTPPTLTLLGMANSAFNFSGNHSNPYIRRVVVYPRAFTDAELQGATV